MTAPRSDPPLVFRARAHGARTALVAADGQASYDELLERSARGARSLLGDRSDLDGRPVAYLVPPGIAHVVTQWSIWRAGGVATPLATSHPAAELAHVLDDAGPDRVIAAPPWHERLAPLCRERGIPLVAAASLDGADGGDASLPSIDADRPALIVYTSGTSGRPKGVVSSHAVLAAQIRSVVDAWAWSPDDRIVHALPLHHLHGILNALAAALWAGACCDLRPRFDAEDVWQRLVEGPAPTLFMGVPTMYVRLLESWDRAAPAERARRSAGARRLRLMVSGSAALPLPVLERWREVTGHVLLERYGMSELGMVLGNPLHGPRHAGFVGVPFPGVEVRLATDDGTAPADGEPGEIQVRGPGVFRGYWRRPAESARAFTADGWFRTGDVAVRDAERGYRILGRASTDILKTGGYKVSALEIEAVLREHPAVADCAVVGLDDPTWGQRVAAALELTAGATAPGLEELRAWAGDRLAPYKLPTRLAVLSALPRNALGKVVKGDVARAFPADASDRPG